MSRTTPTQPLQKPRLSSAGSRRPTGTALSHLPQKNHTGHVWLCGRRLSCCMPEPLSPCLDLLPTPLLHPAPPPPCLPPSSSPADPQARWGPLSGDHLTALQPWAGLTARTTAPSPCPTLCTCPPPCTTSAASSARPPLPRTAGPASGARAPLVCMATWDQGLGSPRGPPRLTTSPL